MLIRILLSYARSRSGQLKQAEAAQIPMVFRPRVSDGVHKKTAKFTIDTLVGMPSLVGKPVKLV